MNGATLGKGGIMKYDGSYVQQDPDDPRTLYYHKKIPLKDGFMETYVETTGPTKRSSKAMMQNSLENMDEDIMDPMPKMSTAMRPFRSMGITPRRIDREMMDVMDAMEDIDYVMDDDEEDDDYEVEEDDDYDDYSDEYDDDDDYEDNDDVEDEDDYDAEDDDDYDYDDDDDYSDDYYDEED
eukprot:CAMPEP_0170167806 /NCGR_PEP_ID=MMETSP0040_2-20121228/1100_1 /TAXON_ID=641309 /ORGANISM="Lotharella oceanica, Strain CCMP622" /LENGTH=180 /DNA_ID=CAMNT_0010405937 /DNA_START=122 /DNA_END=664 /DNA_ORIENTATION=+